MNRVFVTGLGMVSAIGVGKDAHLHSLRNGLSGIGKAKFLNSRYCSNIPFGEVKYSNEELVDFLNGLTFPGATRTDYLAFIAVKEAIQQSNLSDSDLASYNTALITGSTVGGMCKTDELYADANSLKDKSEYISSYGAGVHKVHLAKHFGIKGYTNTINTACSSSANAIMIGMKLIQSKKASRVIVGGVDSLAKFTVNGFNSLQILSENPCRPFDKNRDGLNLGEAGAFLVLESEEVLNGKECLAEVVGYGNSNDAYHPSSLSENAIGVKLAMQRALDKANLSPNQINYINTHGTATPNNDEVENRGINLIFGEQPPIFNSTKTYTGHTLGAAGALEAGIGILSMNNSEVFPSLNIDEPIDEMNIEPNRSLLKLDIDKFMSNSFGFAGNCTSLIFSKS